MTTIERFIKYISYPTTSDSRKSKNPSTEVQREFAKVLINDLNELGLDKIEYDQDNCYIYACLKGDENLPKIGFLAHMDTCEDAKGENISPRFIYNYCGEDIKYNNGLVMKTIDYPDLLNHIGKTLIVTDGTTLLGADDKAGIAEIMGMLEDYKKANITHGDIYVCFMPDEEIGLGTLNFNLEKFPVDYAFSVDGGSLGEFSYENFNAAKATIKIKGTPTHIGYAKDKIVNALLVANKINELLPNELPGNTEGYEGFYHLEKVQGKSSSATVTYLIRDFNKLDFEIRKLTLRNIIDKLNQIYGNCISIVIKDTYYNMKEHLNANFSILPLMNAAIKLNIEFKIVPVRGGFDGAEITLMGIPCPNICTGGHNFHSVFEYITVEDMLKNQELLTQMVREYSKNDVLKLNRTNKNS